MAERGLDGVEALVHPSSLDPQEQKASQAKCPNRHEEGKYDRSCIEAARQQQGCNDEAEVGQTAREIVVVLGLRHKRGHEDDPLDGER